MEVDESILILLHLGPNSKYLGSWSAFQLHEQFSEPMILDRAIVVMPSAGKTDIEYHQFLFLARVHRIARPLAVVQR